MQPELERSLGMYNPFPDNQFRVVIGGLGLVYKCRRHFKTFLWFHACVSHIFRVAWMIEATSANDLWVKPNVYILEWVWCTLITWWWYLYPEENCSIRLSCRSVPLYISSLLFRLWPQREPNIASCVKAAAVGLITTACGLPAALATTTTPCLSSLPFFWGWTTSCLSGRLSHVCIHARKSWKFELWRLAM